jgi:hypothetical protein
MPIVFKTEEERNPTKPIEIQSFNPPADAKSGAYEEFSVEEDLTQPIFAEGEEEKQALDFILEFGLYNKFLLWCGIQDQLKNLKNSLEIQEG